MKIRKPTLKKEKGQVYSLRAQTDGMSYNADC